MFTLPVATGDQPSGNQENRRELLKTVVAASLVTGLEMFDFTVFGFFAVVIGDQFFPAKDPMTSLLWAVGTFGVGFFMRPLGAMIIGAYADRVGRRAAMTRTSWMMALGTAALGLCTPFASIGVIAPIVVIAGRALQGFAVGGDIGVAATFVMEAGPVSRRGYLVSWQLTSQGAAALLGATLGVLLTSTLSPAALASWGWRIPFLIGLLIAPVGLYVRHRLRDGPISSNTARHAGIPLAELCREHGTKILLAMLMMMVQTIPVYAIVYYMPSYVTRVMHLPAVIGFLASALSALLLVVIPPLSGRLLVKLGWFDRVFSSPSNHRVHHAVNDQYLNKNYGGMFVIWDRMFGTFAEEEEPCVYGTRTPLRSWDPGWAILAEYWSLVQATRQAKSWGDKWRIWLKPPGWRPSDSSGNLQAEPSAPTFDLNAASQLYGEPVARSAAIFAVVQFALMMGATASYLWYAEELSYSTELGLTAVIVAGLWALGAYLQGRVSVIPVILVDLAGVAAAVLMFRA